LNYDELGRPF